MRATLPIFSLISLLWLAACASAANTQPDTLTVFAAASLAEAFQEVGKRFEAAHPGARLVFNFAGSQQLSQQIAQGAPADVFASADRSQMDTAVQSGRIVDGTARVFAGNKLILIYAPGNPGSLSSLNDLSNPGLKLVMADSKVPAGKYTLELLDNLSQAAGYGAEFKDQVLANVVSYEENVRAVLSKVLLGEADAGFVYQSDVTPAAQKELGVIPIPDDVNIIASYWIAPLKDSAQPEQVQVFIDYLLSRAGQDIMAQFGFLPIP